MKTTCFLFFVCCLMETGCKNKPEQQVTAAEIDQNIVLARQLSEVDTWAAGDYERGVILLSNIKEKNPKGFAVYLKGEGNGLFNRLVDYHRYDSLFAGKNNDQQFEVVLPLSTAISRLVRVCYGTETINGKLLYGKEIISSMIASLILDSKTISLVNIKYPDKEALDPVRKEGWQKAQSGSFAMIYGALVTISNDSRLYEHGDILRLATLLPKFINETGSFLTQESRDAITQELKKIKASSASPEIKQALGLQ